MATKKKKSTNRAKPKTARRTPSSIKAKAALSQPNIKKPRTAALRKKVAKKQNITEKTPSRMSMKTIFVQVLVAGSAVAVLLLLGWVERDTFSTGTSDAAGSVPVTIGLEHEKPLSLVVLFAKKERAGYLSLTNRSNQTIHISLPSTWSRTEVNGANIADLSPEIPVFGFTRWTLPPFAGMKMLLPEAPSAVFFDDTSDATAAVELSMVDLDTLSRSNRVILVQKQALAPLWQDEE